MKGWARAKPQYKAWDVVVQTLGVVRPGRGCSAAIHGWVGLMARSSH